MKSGLFALLVFLLVPLQTTLVDSVSPWGIRPDVCLVAACAVGFWGGPRQGLLVGLTGGFLQDIFSAGGLWVNMATKAGAGLLAAATAQQLTNTTSRSLFLPCLVISFFTGAVLLVSSGLAAQTDTLLYGIRAILLPQGVLDGLVAMGTHWCLTKWFPHQDDVSSGLWR